MRFLLVLLAVMVLASCSQTSQTYDVVLRDGRVMDPESGLDAVRSVGIIGKTIAAISP
jgi:N-acyl-D-glutamate deacylase